MISYLRWEATAHNSGRLHSAEINLTWQARLDQGPKGDGRDCRPSGRIYKPALDFLDAKRKQ